MNAAVPGGPNGGVGMHIDPTAYYQLMLFAARQ